MPVKAKKSFGQHFLHREDIARAIAGSLQSLPNCPRVLEVGPGRGMLTRFLKELPIHLRMAEADTDMVSYLARTHPEWMPDILEADFLKLRLEEVFEGESFAIIGNFPYNISSQIVFRMLHYRELVPEMVGMFQREMAERIVSPPGTKDYGVISVLTQAYYEGEMLFGVDRTAFHPPPKVQSAVIRLRRRADQDIGCGESLFRAVVKQAFNQRRKMLRNSLKSLITDPEFLADQSLSQRPEMLGVADFVALSRRIAQLRIDSQA